MRRTQSIEQEIAEQATGCLGAGDYRKWATAHGYSHCEVWDWTSSAGDWNFIVSKDGSEWYMLSQSNNWPRSGFTRTVDKSMSWFGSKEDVYQQIAEEQEAMYR